MAEPNPKAQDEGGEKSRGNMEEQGENIPPRDSLSTKVITLSSSFTLWCPWSPLVSVTHSIYDLE